MAEKPEKKMFLTKGKKPQMKKKRRRSNLLTLILGWEHRALRS